MHEARSEWERARLAVQRARDAQVRWSARSARERGRILRRFRDQLIDRMEEVVATASRETSKPRFDLVGEIFHCCNLIGSLGRKGPRWLKARRVWPRLFFHKTSEIQHAPFGVIGVISPWNYPIVLTLAPVVQALLAGNGVVLKPSERAWETASLLASLFAEATAADPILQVLHGGPQTALALADSGLDKLVFIGGERGGREIALAAARRMIPTVMELGGNDAMIVAANADLPRAARGAVWGAFFNAGQSCIAVERCLVESSVVDPFLEQVVAATATLQTGLPAPGDPDLDSDVGPLIARHERERIEFLIRDAVNQGARIEIGGIPDDRETQLFPPTVLSHVTPDMRIFQEEIFGPVLLVSAVDRLDDAVALANNSRYGLAASVWSRDLRLARHVASRLRVGGVSINDCLTQFGIVELPFGGVRASGFGRLQGREGLLEFCSPRTVTWQRWYFGREWHWFPTGRKHRWLAWLVRWMFRGGVASRFHGRSGMSAYCRRTDGA